MTHRINKRKSVLHGNNDNWVGGIARRSDRGAHLANAMLLHLPFPYLKKTVIPADAGIHTQAALPPTQHGSRRSPG
jgi:hypothetical protein